MTHRMILATADLKTIHAVVIAKKKIASVAQVAEHAVRTREDGASSASAGSN